MHDLSSAQDQGIWAELAAVRAQLKVTYGDLAPLLGHFVRREVAAAEPLPRAMVVLAVAVPATDSDEARQRRIMLAAALEMLHVALGIHKNLFLAAGRDDIDRSLVGATILMGDYSFGRAAALAAETDSPAVVEIFAQALKQISEGHLRRLDPERRDEYLESQDLYQAGAQAAAHLAALPSAQAEAVAAFAARLGAQMDRGQMLPRDPFPAELEQLPPAQLERWQGVLTALEAPPPPRAA